MSAPSPSAPAAPLQVSSASRPTPRQRAVSGHAPAVKEAARRISELLERNPGRAFFTDEIAARLSLDVSVVRAALSKPRRSERIIGVATENRGASGKWRYRWRECPA